MTSFKLVSDRVLLEEDYESSYDEFYRRGWTDGLPFVLPKPERVERMVLASDRDPQEEVAVIPPHQGSATIEKLAVNAVMAGCRAEYFPVLLAVVEAVADPVFNLHGIQCTTSPAAVLTIVNGPIRQALEINYSYGCFGPGWRANATIGRALRLALLNIGGSKPGEVSKSTHGQPGRYTMCIGEFEEKSPWEPLHVERGFRGDESTVTVFAATELTSIADTRSTTARGILTSMAHSIDGIGSNHMIEPYSEGESVLILCPDHAALAAQGGLSKADAKEFLYNETKDVPLSRWPEERHQYMLRGDAMHPPRVHDGTVSLHQRPEKFVIVVAGGLGGYHSAWCPTYNKSDSVTKPIRWSGA